MKVADFLRTLCASLSRQPDSLSLEDTPQTVEEWDSIGHLTIIATVEEALGIEIDDKELRTFTSIGELVDRLKTRKALEE